MAGASSKYYLVEFDGVTFCQASEFELGEVKHEPYKIHVGNQPNPILGRGGFEVGECKIKHANGLHNTDTEMHKIFDDFIRGRSTAKPTIRVIQLNEDGFSPMRVHEFIECVPTTYKVEPKKGDAKDAAMFSFGFMPTDYKEA
jgi:hypothetical protein